MRYQAFATALAVTCASAAAVPGCPFSGAQPPRGGILSNFPPPGCPASGLENSGTPTPPGGPGGSIGGGAVGDFMPPGPGDVRSPCPMMNTLANHGFLPRNGMDLTKEAVVNGLSQGLRFDTTLASIMFDKAVVANPAPNPTFFTLEQLNVHNVLEHDASLSRPDATFGNPQAFDKDVFAQSTRFWTASVLTPAMLANSKMARQVDSKAFNPGYVFTADTENFSLGEVSAPIVAFGDLQTGTVDQNLVVYFFENERFPTELGRTLRPETVTPQDILRMTQMIANASNLITGPQGGLVTQPPSFMGRDLHSGFV